MNRIIRKLISITAIGFLFVVGVPSISMFVNAEDSTASITQTEELRNEQVVAGFLNYFLIDSRGTLWASGENGEGQLGDSTSEYRRAPVKVLENVKSVSTGFVHSLAVKTDGSLWAWGRNDRGQLGNGTTTSSNTPIKIMDDVVDIATGQYHSLAIKSDGSLWGWGYNGESQLGDGTTTIKYRPFKIMENVTSITAGETHTLALKTDRSIWAWGYNSFGQLGDGTNVKRSLPVRVMENVAEVSAGMYHSTAVKNDGSLWSWGFNGNGQLGDGTSTSRSTPIKVMDNVTKISAGYYHTLATKSDGSLWSWGYNYFKQLGDGTSLDKTIPLKIMENVASLSGGSHHSIVIKDDGSLWTWGVVDTLDVGGFIEQSIPKIIKFEFLTDLQIETEALEKLSVASGIYYSLFVKSDRSLWSQGYNDYGQLGDGTTTNRSTPLKIMENVKDVFADYSHSMAIKTDGSLWTWGMNSYGQLGDGTKVTRLLPIKVMNDVISASAGNFYSLAIKSDNSLWAWGDNQYGQLGDGTRYQRLNPIKVLENIVSVSAGAFHTLAVTSDGGLWAWGMNAYGQIGNGLTETVLSPIKIMDNVVSASAGEYHSLAITDDGSMWSWGSNSEGQLGDGTNINRLIPIKVMNDVIHVDAGRDKSLAIKTDRSLWTWGDSLVGDGTFSPSNYPTRVLENVVSALSIYNTFAIRSDGSVWGWGFNSYGSLGNGNTNSEYSPIQILKSQLIYETSSQNSYYLPIFECSPNIKLTFSGDINAKFNIASQDVPGNFSILSDNQIVATENGNATINITNSSGTVIYRSVIFTAYSEKPIVYSLTPIDKVTNQSYRINIQNSTSATLNGEPFFGGLVSNEGTYNLKTYDIAGFEYISAFSVDKTPPTITINPYTIDPTNQNITVTASINDGYLLTSSHTFTQNGSFDFKATDDAGNVSIKTVTISNIDKDPPVINGVSISGSYNTARTITFTEGTVLLDGVEIQTGTIVETEGTHGIVAIDRLGNTITFSFTLDFTVPTISIGNYNQSITNQNVIVTATVSGGVLNSSSHTFTQNGSYDFVATDNAGNVSTQTVTITNIDKESPAITIGDYIKSPTNKDIIVTASTNEGTMNSSSHTFTENGLFEFVATDLAGNVSTQIVTITNIDKVTPIITIGEYIKTPTNLDIDVSVSSNEGTLNASSHTFTENGSFDFVATDDAGNVSTKTVVITSIDKVSPLITIGDYQMTPTNKDIIVSATTNEGTLNSSSHTFTQNGSFEFVSTDSAGNVATQTVTITNIDKAAPVITIGDYLKTPTNQDIIVSVTTNEGTLNASSYTFSENKSYEFVATDAAGNVTTQTVTITNIDKVVPVITIGDYLSIPTNQDVIVSATTNEGTLNSTSHTFMENGSFEFVATDAAGNVTTQTVTITNIDKAAPVITIGDYLKTPTNQNVIVTASTKDGTLNSISHTFSENGQFTFSATDEAGNISESTVTITNIDKDAPIITIGNYIKTPTNEDIIVTAASNEGLLNETGFTFVSNGQFTFSVTDEAGNYSETTVIITNIDKEAPIISIEEYLKTPTNQDILVTTSTNEGTMNSISHTFTENGFFEFIATDEAGNVTKQTVTITNIDKALPIITIGDYQNTPINKDVIVTASTNEGTLNSISHTFTENGSFEFIVTDEAGNVTKQTVTITNIDKVPPVITIGDYVKTPTNQDVIVNASTNEGTLNSTSYTFTENGSFEFITTDEAGNVTKQTVTITNIDKMSPVITIGDYVNTPINKDVIVTAFTSEGTLNSMSHTFIENGSFEFIATDEAGNVTKQTVTITNIDKVSPVITGVLEGKTYTESLVPTFVEGVGLLDDSLFVSGSSISSYGQHTLIVTDEAGNTTMVNFTIVPISTIISVTSHSYTSLHVSWNEVDGVAGYEVYRGFNATGSFAKVAMTDAVDFIHTGLATNRSYFYKVRSYVVVEGITYYSDFSLVVSGKPIPATPSSIDVVPVNSSSMQISWAPVEGATGYQLFRSFGPTGTFTLAASTTTNSYLNTGLGLNRTYFYRVRAYTMVGTTRVVGPYSTIDSAKPIPAAATNIFAASGGFDRINLSWTPAVGAGGYTIYRATSLTGTYSIVGNVTTSNFINTGLAFNTTYYYKVRSFYMVNGVKNYGLMSEPVSAKTVLSTPIVTSSNLSTTSIKLSWGAISGASGYEVYRSTTSTGTYALQGTVTTNSYSKTGLVRGTVYYYKVRAYRLVGSSKIYGDFSTSKYLKVGY